MTTEKAKSPELEREERRLERLRLVAHDLGARRALRRSRPGSTGRRLTNVFRSEWDATDDWSGGGAKSKRLVERGTQLGASLYELGPGNSVVYHFHHGSEELLIVLSGRPTLRTPEGERQVAEGEVVHFPLGPDGAHGSAQRQRGRRPLCRRRHSCLTRGRRISGLSTRSPRRHERAHRAASRSS